MGQSKKLRVSNLPSFFLFDTKQNINITVAQFLQTYFEFEWNGTMKTFLTTPGDREFVQNNSH